MNEGLSHEDRCHVRRSLIASLAFVFTLLLSTFAMAGGQEPAGGARASTVPVPVPAPVVSGPAEDTSIATLGCGEAESCYASR